MISLDVSNAMTTPVRTTTADHTAVEAAREMRESGIGALVVVDDSETTSPRSVSDETARGLAGIVTQSDVLGLVADGTDVAGASVGDIMSSPVVTIDSDTRVLAAAELMKEHSVRRLPVTDDGELVGIVTTTDLTHYLPRLRNTILRERGEKNTIDGAPTPQ